MTVTLEPELAARLRDEAALRSVRLEDMVSRLLEEALEWEARERAESLEAARVGFADLDAGRTRPIEDLQARLRRMDPAPE